MIIKRKNSKQTEIPREDVSEVQPAAANFEFEPLPQAEQFFDAQDFEMMPEEAGRN